MTDPISVALRDLKSPKSKNRAFSADVLGQLASQEENLSRRGEVVLALQGALSDTEPMVRYNAALSLGELEAKEAKEDLIRLMQDPDPLVRQGGAIALGEIGDFSVRPILEDALQSGTPEVRFQAIVSLVNLLGEEALPLVKRTLQDPDGEVRAQAIGGLHDLLKNVPEAKEECLRLVRPFLSDLHPEARFEAALLLAALGERVAASVLLDFIKHKAHSLDACEALGKLGDVVALTPLRKLWQGFFTAPVVALRAAQAVVRLDPRGAQKEREFLYKNAKKQSEVRPMALSYIAELSEEEGLSLLCEMLQDPRELMALSLIDLLVEAYPRARQASKEEIIASLKAAKEGHTDDETRSEAKVALEKLQPTDPEHPYR